MTRPYRPSALARGISPWPFVFLAAVVATSPGSMRAQTSVGLIAYWNAENGATDVTGNGHDGVFQGNAATMAAGPFGSAFTFDGDGDFIQIGDELDMGASDFTLSAWFNGDPTMNQWGRIFDKGYFSGYALGRRSLTNAMGFEMLGSNPNFGTTSPLVDNAWHHLALVKSGSTVTIYANGAAEGTGAVSAAPQNNALPLLIGYNPGEGTRGYWKGMLDELRIYDRPLSNAEVAALAGVPDPGDGLIAYWNAENGATDVTGNGHDGVLQGNATTTASGPFGNAFTFDGDGDYIDIGDELDMGTSDFTLSAWINGDPTMNQWGRIFDKGYFSGYAFGRRSITGAIGFEMLASNPSFGAASTLVDNEWRHVALVKSGSTVTIYADGEAEGTGTVNAAAQDNALPLLIGYNPGEGTRGYWKGMLDELRIYDRALTPLQIAALANATIVADGDFNHDGSADGADFLSWQRGQSPNPLSAGDLAIWKAHFGRPAGLADADAVPEPASMLLLTSAALLLPARGRALLRRAPAALSA